MRLSISSSEYEAGYKSFFGQSCLLILTFTLMVLAASWIIGARVRPEVKQITDTISPSHRHRILTLGNSRFRTSIDGAVLSNNLCSSHDVEVVQLNGSSWNSLQYLALARVLDSDLRPENDLILIEVSPLSLDDGESLNRLDAIPSRELAYIALLPQVPFETRLEAIFAAIFTAYRAKITYHPEPYHTWGVRASTVAFNLLHSLEPKSGTLDRPDGFAIVEAQTQPISARVLAERRSQLSSSLASLRFGGYKLEALRQTIGILRNRHIAVFLVQTPTALWLNNKLEETPAGSAFRKTMPELANSMGATYISGWPRNVHDSIRFEDDMHMLGGQQGSVYFSQLLAQLLKEKNVCGKWGLMNAPSPKYQSF